LGSMTKLQQNAPMVERKSQILIVDDDPQIQQLLEEYVSSAGFDIDVAKDGAAFRSAVKKHDFDLVILDLLLPDSDGISLARDLRRSSDTPIIILTTKSDEVERIIGLEIGADDYVSKPFSPRELLARIKSLLWRIETAKRQAQARSDLRVRLRFADWEFDMTSRRLLRGDGAEIRLTNAEYQLLATFVERPQRVLSRDQLLEFSRTDPDAVFDRAIDYLILRLRKKLEADSRRPELIKTEHGAGYIFTPDVVRL